MNEKPILFNSEMVRAVLDLRKTQTRRVLDMKKYGGYLQETDTAPGNPAYPCYQDEYGDSHPTSIKCPYGKKGDRLWVRETWAYHPDMPKTPEEAGILYKSDEDTCADKPGLFWQMNSTGIEHEVIVDKYKPSIHMFRWMSRINLEITDIRVERVQDISWDDAVEEGIFKHYDFYEDMKWVTPEPIIEDYEELWDSINKKRGFGWGVNPWVWVVEFKLLKSC